MQEPALDFVVHHDINHIVPRPRLHLLPKPISWILGYRSQPMPQIGSVLVWLWAFVGAFAGLLVVQAVFQSKGIKVHGAPTVIASFGAAAILEYHTIDSPLSQPRNVILGELFAAIIGVGITKLFQLNSNFENLRWVAGALSVGITSAFMGFTNTIHPPAGATALLAATTPEITELGWFLIPLILLGSVLLVAVGCVTNNIQRQFPIYWWTPVDLCRPNGVDIEKQGQVGENDTGVLEGSPCEKRSTAGRPHIMVSDRLISIPDWLSLDSEERWMLEVLRSKLREGLGSTSSRVTEGTLVHDPDSC
ncbi:HPP family protein-like protein [Hyaloscypha bicolor E]|uniref:HPP family protein-like protein n=1 Tax=Hyaloscypha bicolor E TaxID=1095630 RepID=A0A2J6SM36_9HELO|nr:HPP family protein-like protein [Hyaloscypha bicolor E]PMD51831.1 HPP family protein-like protein [Hyaloscypha bicolor E]